MRHINPISGVETINIVAIWDTQNLPTETGVSLIMQWEFQVCHVYLKSYLGDIDGLVQERCNSIANALELSHNWVSARRT